MKITLNEEDIIVAIKDFIAPLGFDIKQDDIELNVDEYKNIRVEINLNKIVNPE